ncbi:MAG: dihydroorotate dehydrogenase [Candidatus Marinimicrobia bacterium CG08_land_8_20_14_0_20_45_22]|nr:MAG: dihydroorotate dehydrogenase [Candidatus Marinimicrobia bacterium CG08_land_8_20_14_0_20_45_22]
MIDLKTQVGAKLQLKNPILTASGTFGYGDELMDLIDLNRFGGIVTKSLTLHPRAGNPSPRITETTAGMINSIGLANIGVDAFIEQKSESLRRFQGKVIANIAGRTEDEYAETLIKLESQEWIAGYEINVSCPNVREGGIEFGAKSEVLDHIVERFRDLTGRFLMIKLSPNVTDIRILAEVCQKRGADAVSMINTVYGAAIDIKTRRPLINTVIGGLSGPAIKPIAIANIIKTHQAVDIPIVGVGGITCGADVVEFLLAGASAVELGTVNFFDLNAVGEILEFLEEYGVAQGVRSVTELVGKVKI